MHAHLYDVLLQPTPLPGQWDLATIHYPRWVHFCAANWYFSIGLAIPTGHLLPLTSQCRGRSLAFSLIQQYLHSISSAVWISPRQTVGLCFHPRAVDCKCTRYPTGKSKLLHSAAKGMEKNTLCNINDGITLLPWSPVHTEAPAQRAQQRSGVVWLPSDQNNQSPLSTGLTHWPCRDLKGERISLTAHWCCTSWITSWVRVMESGWCDIANTALLWQRFILQPSAVPLQKGPLKDLLSYLMSSVSTAVWLTDNDWMPGTH